MKPEVAYVESTGKPLRVPYLTPGGSLVIPFARIRNITGGSPKVARKYTILTGAVRQEWGKSGVSCRPWCF